MTSFSPPTPRNPRPSRESQALLEKEKSLLQARCLELEEALHRKQEEMENQLAEQQQISKSWRDRWEQATAALKSKEEQSAETHRQSQTFSPKVSWETSLSLRLPSFLPSRLLVYLSQHPGVLRWHECGTSSSLDLHDRNSKRMLYVWFLGERFPSFTQQSPRGFG